ncbi:hypothetical protein BG015_002190 [Linnemannia schmuckeri]|uniref:Uncharacterized protein n=1 Tax=Linnemannia schmuckeri TaxID=64567 RepID=A0A9P5V6K4_9FUNG|nr:hypothetical protein BG015_002190 [Linnemannia schmuckeri]
MVAMATTEITMSGTMYPSSVYSQSTVTSPPFKPLIVPTETDTSSVHDESADADENKEPRDDSVDEGGAEHDDTYNPDSPIIHVGSQDALQHTINAIN